ncbi:MAG: hypothetical protein WD652_04770 [Acidimicrobiia bacterium]
MTDSRRRIDQIQDPGFLVNLEDLTTEVVRSRRQMCDDLDVELSYYRRMLHGRMDLAAFEMRRRAGDETDSLIDALPRILSEGAYKSSDGLPERMISVEVPDIPSPGRRLVDRALEGDFLTRLPSVTDDDLRETQAFLTEVEAAISHQRRIAHAALDRLQEELTRRYREGLADPGELLARG